MREGLIKTSNAIIEWGILLAVFLVPLIFFPFVSDLGTFEFAKQMVLYLLVGVMLFFWTLRMVLEENVEIKRTAADSFIFLFLLVSFLSSVFSLSQWTSVFGDHPRLHGGFISYFIYVIFFFVAISHLRERKQFLRALAALFVSAFVLSLVGILRFFKANLGVVDFSESVWMLIGSTQKATMFLSMVFPLMLGSLFFAKERAYKFILGALGIVLLGYAGLLNHHLALLLMAFAGGGFLVFTKKTVSERLYIAALALVLIAIVALSNVAPLKERIPYFKDLSASREVSLNHQTGWVVVLGGFNFPKQVFLGSGPGTYTYDFTSFRPIGLNATPFWNIKFSRSSNEIFQLISTIGLLGLFVFLSVFIWSLQRAVRELSKKRGEETPILLGLVLGIVNGLVFFIFTTSATATMFVLWLYLALLFAGFGIWRKSVLVRSVKLSLSTLPVIEGLVTDKGKRRGEMLGWILFGGTSILFLIFFLFEGKYFLAELSYKKSLRASTVGDAVTQSSRAARLFPQNETYRMNVANIALSSAITFASGKQDLSQDEQQDLLTLLVTARDEANAAVSLAPRNAAGWETRGNVFLALANRFNVEGAEDEALDSYARASQFSPTVPLDSLNPRYPTLRGVIHLRFKDNLDLAEQNFFIALNLKRDYAPALYNLAAVSRARGQIEQARTLLSQVIAGYDSLDPAVLADLGIPKEQIEQELATLTQVPQPEGEEESGL